jgi:hypothetical protein
MPYAGKMAADTSAFVRREVAVSLRDLPYEKTKPILLGLMKNYDGEDRWYLETLGSNLKGHESEIYPEVIKMFGEGKPASQWNKQMTGFAWRLHPAEAAADLALRANNSSLSAVDRQAALTALALSMIKLWPIPCLRFQKAIFRMYLRLLLTGCPSGKVTTGTNCLTGVRSV